MFKGCPFFSLGASRSDAELHKPRLRGAEASGLERDARAGISALPRMPLVLGILTKRGLILNTARPLPCLVCRVTGANGAALTGSDGLVAKGGIGFLEGVDAIGAREERATF